MSPFCYLPGDRKTSGESLNPKSQCSGSQACLYTGITWGASKTPMPVFQSKRVCHLIGLGCGPGFKGAKEPQLFLICSRVWELLPQCLQLKFVWMTMPIK